MDKQIAAGRLCGSCDITIITSPIFWGGFFYCMRRAIGSVETIDAIEAIESIVAIGTVEASSDMI